MLSSRATSKTEGHVMLYKSTILYLFGESSESRQYEYINIRTFEYMTI